MPNQYDIDPARDAEIAALAEQLGSKRGAARELGISKDAVNKAVERNRRRILEGRGVQIFPGMDVSEVTDVYDDNGELARSTVTQRPASEPSVVEQDKPLPGFVFKRISTNFARDGSINQQWQIQSPERVQVANAMRIAADELARDLPRVPATDAPALSDDMLCTTYTLTDAHIGMLAWHREGGEDWDLEIAERVIIACFERAVASTPPSEQAILNQCGDALHYDSLMSVTPTSGHVLDADGRFTKMVEVTVRILRRVVDMLLAKHPKVHVVMAEGNHDMASSVWLRVMFKAIYENEPRVTVDDSALPFYAFEWGQTMQVFHHSHLVKFDQIGRKVPAMFPEMWGRCKHRYVHTGNYHHKREKDEDGIETIQHPTLAARDAYAARGAWFAKRSFIPITYHKEHGEVMRTTISPAMIQIP